MPCVVNWRGGEMWSRDGNKAWRHHLTSVARVRPLLVFSRLPQSVPHRHSCYVNRDWNYMPRCTARPTTATGRSCTTGLYRTQHNGHGVAVGRQGPPRKRAGWLGVDRWFKFDVGSAAATTDKRVGGVERWLRFILAHNGRRLSARRRGSLCDSEFAVSRRVSTPAPRRPSSLALVPTHSHWYQSVWWVCRQEGWSMCGSGPGRLEAAENGRVMLRGIRRNAGCWITVNITYRYSVENLKTTAQL